MHVFGSGRGESILIRLPEGQWGLVDHYASSPNDPASSPVRDYLDSQGVEQLEFVCLTHPHDDHYRGLIKILERFVPRHLWLFPALDPRTAKRLEEYIGLVEHDSCDHQGDADELAQILNWCNQRKKRGKNRCRIKFVGLGKDLYPSPERPNAVVKIRGMGPPDPLISSYTNDLLACFRADGTLRQKLPHRCHNRISAALVVDWNRTRILLGGDVERDGWSYILEECPERLRSCAAVKVSHHGSKHGYCDSLWSRMGDKISTIAILTPFHSQDLPHADALKHISIHVSSLYSTAPLQGTTQPVVQVNAPLVSRQALRAQLGAVQARVSKLVGRCSFVFDDQGRCRSKQIIPPALMHEML